jgi:hypothetical protein
LFSRIFILRLFSISTFVVLISNFFLCRLEKVFRESIKFVEPVGGARALIGSFTSKRVLKIINLVCFQLEAIILNGRGFLNQTHATQFSKHWFILKEQQFRIPIQMKSTMAVNPW